jgi:hypothetical protein
MNKYANTYLEKLMESVKNYRLLNPTDILEKGMPAGAVLGAGIGGISGLLKTPKRQIVETEAGPQVIDEGRLNNALRSAVVGGLAGAAAPAALGALGRSTATVDQNSLLSKILTDSQQHELAKRVLERARIKDFSVNLPKF